jgi:hypothetical protein
MQQSVDAEGAFLWDGDDEDDDGDDDDDDDDDGGENDDATVTTQRMNRKMRERFATRSRMCAPLPHPHTQPAHASAPMK